MTDSSSQLSDAQSILGGLSDFELEQLYSSSPSYKVVEYLWTIGYKDRNPKLVVKSRETCVTVPDMDILEQFLSQRSDSRPLAQQLGDEYEDYCYIKPEARVSNIIQWWNDHSTLYPALSRMARDILSISAMSAEVEQVFSSARLLISDARNRLKEDIVEACECLKSWNNAGMYRSYN